MTTPRHARRPWLLALAAAAAGLALPPGGCATDPRDGYAFSSAVPRDATTIQVPMFVNATPEPGQEVLLTEAIIKEAQRRGWRVVQSPTAQTTLTGTLRGAELRRLSVDPTTGYVQEMGMVIAVDFDWSDNRTGKTLVSRRGFAASDTFAPQARASESIDQARLGAYGRLARDLINELHERW
ncbi:MAG: hypothetical protein HRU70_03560 [Phycisphaeraceae bacterium]|nr:MAG: hypothetical protein HRU70_03560 [Phycisphaeraceae bacterium]